MSNKRKNGPDIECAQDGCTRSAYRRGLCRKHYKETRSEDQIAADKAWRRQYEADNREKINKQSRAWRRANPEKSREISRRAHTKNKDREAEQRRQWRKDHPEKARERDRASREKRTTEQQRQYDANYYAKHGERVRTNSARWRAEHRERAKETIRQWQIANPERHAQNRRNRAQRRRARLKGCVVEDFTDLEVFEDDGWICGICDTPIDQTLKSPSLLAASLDHIIPLARGGNHTRANVQASHLICNSMKSDRLQEEIDLERVMGRMLDYYWGSASVGPR